MMQELGKELERMGFLEDRRRQGEVRYRNSLPDTGNEPDGSPLTTTTMTVIISFDHCANNMQGPFSDDDFHRMRENLRHIARETKKYHVKRKENEQAILDMLFCDRFHQQPRKFQVMGRRSQPNITPSRPPSFFRRVAHKHRESMPHG